MLISSNAISLKRISQALCYAVHLKVTRWISTGLRPNGTSDRWQAPFHFLLHADFAVFRTCTPKADQWCDATVCPFDLKIAPEHCTNAISNISEAHPNRPSGRKVSWDIRGTFFVSTHGIKLCFEKHQNALGICSRFLENQVFHV